MFPPIVGYAQCFLQIYEFKEEEKKLTEISHTQLNVCVIAKISISFCIYYCLLWK